MDDNEALRARREELRHYSYSSSTGFWIVGSLITLFILGLVIWGDSDGRNIVASDERPAATAPGTTTGSGATAPPARQQPAQR